MLLKDTA